LQNKQKTRQKFLTTRRNLAPNIPLSLLFQALQRLIRSTVREVLNSKRPIQFYQFTSLQTIL
jgi:hypothetical protein